MLVRRGPPARGWRSGRSPACCAAVHPQTLDWCAGQMHQARSTATAAARSSCVACPTASCASTRRRTRRPRTSALGITGAARRQRRRRPGTAQRAARRDVRAAASCVVPVLDRARRAARHAQRVLRPPAPASLRQWLESPLVDDIFYIGDSATGSELGTGVRRARARSRSSSWPATTASSCGATPTSHAAVAGADRVLLRLRPDLHGAQPRASRTRRSPTSCSTGSLGPRRGIRPGFPEDPDVLLSPVLRSERFFGYVARTRSAGGATPGARRPPPRGRRVGVRRPGLFLEPTVLRVDGLDGCRDAGGGARARRSSRCCRSSCRSRRGRRRTAATRCIEFVNSQRVRPAQLGVGG